MRAPQSAEEVDELEGPPERRVHAEQRGNLGAGGERAADHEKVHRRRRRAVEEALAERLEERDDPALGLVQLGWVVVSLPLVVEGRAARMTRRPELDLVVHSDELVTALVLCALQQRGLHGLLAENLADIWE
eukprot:744431-Rhodomonas_salina.2